WYRRDIAERAARLPLASDRTLGAERVDTAREGGEAAHDREVHAPRDGAGLERGAQGRALVPRGTHGPGSPCEGGQWTGGCRGSRREGAPAESPGSGGSGGRHGA